MAPTLEFPWVGAFWNPSSVIIAKTRLRCSPTTSGIVPPVGGGATTQVLFALYCATRSGPVFVPS